MNTSNQSKANLDPLRPLVVDLDGTLIKTDLTLETIGQYLARRPWGLFTLMAWLARGRPYLKARLNECTAIDAGTLPYSEPVLEWLKAEKAAGRRLVLATASHQSLADAVARHVGIFDEVLGTSGDINLKSSAKRDELVRRYGAKGFDYAGNSTADIAIWSSAAQAHVVSASSRLIRQAQSLAPGGRVFSPDRKSQIPCLIRTLRPHQWIKNLLIFLPVLGAHAFESVETLIRAGLAFLAFGFAASSAYVLNDLTDISSDRQHHRKRNRAFSAGDLDIWMGWMLWPSLLVAALALSALALPVRFMAALGVYYAVTLAYSFRLKRMVLVDVLTLAGLYTLRIIAGGAAVGIPLTFWILAFSMFLFVSLAFIKRFSEIASRSDEENRVLPGRGYRNSDRELVASLGATSGYLAVLVLALYVNDPQTAALYRSPKIIWLACPLLMLWISRAWLIAHRREMHDDPIVFALKDRMSWLIAALFVAVFVLARLVGE